MNENGPKIEDFNNNQEGDKENYDWRIHQPEVQAEKIKELDEALRLGDNNKVIDILKKKDTKLLRTLVINREFKDLNDAFGILLQESFGKDADIYNLDSEQVVRALKENGIPEQFLSELTDAAYHNRDEKKFFRLLTIIHEATESEDIKNIALNNEASWRREIEGDKNSAVTLNKMALDKNLNQEGGENLILTEKLKVGMVSNKNLKPKQRAEELSLVSERMEALDDRYDAHRTRVAEAKARLKSTEGQNKLSSEREENIEKAKKLCEEALQYAEQNNYKNLSVVSCEVLAKVYDLLENKKEAGKYNKKSQKKRQRSGYKTNSDF